MSVTDRFASLPSSIVRLTPTSVIVPDRSSAIALDKIVDMPETACGTFSELTVYCETLGL